MSAPTLHRPPTTSRPAPPARRRRPRLLLIAACLLVVSAAAGAGLALAGRSSTGSSAAATAATEPAGPGQPAEEAGRASDARAKDDAEPRDGAGSQDRGSGSADTAGGAAVLPDGVHHALIRRVDVASGRLTVDVVQAFLDGDAVKAAMADGKSREEARYLTAWLRNENPRLRTLPVAAGFRADLFQPCDESPDRRAVLEQLAANARAGVYFYSMTVRDGVVHAVTERLIHPAC
jgi:hypothetical protein